MSTIFYSEYSLICCGWRVHVFLVVVVFIFGDVCIYGVFVVLCSQMLYCGWLLYCVGHDCISVVIAYNSVDDTYIYASHWTNGGAGCRYSGYSPRANLPNKNCLYPLGFIVASPWGNRSAGYPIGTGLIPSGFHGSFAEWFAYSALELGYLTGKGTLWASW